MPGWLSLFISEEGSNLESRKAIQKMGRQPNSDIFELDEDERKSDDEAPSAPSPMAEDEDEEDDYYEVTEAGPSDRGSIDPFRRAMPQIEVEEDVCSICLDAFTDDDPGNATVCG